MHFRFDDNSEYWTFVKSIDILRIEGANNYMRLDNDLWFYNFPTDTTSVSWTCGATNIDVAYEKSDASCYKKVLTGTIIIWKNSCQIILTFTGFLISLFILKQQK